MNSTEILSKILISYKALYAKKPSASNFLSNKKGDSFYSIQNRGEGKQVVQLRLSNHGTYLKTWVDREELSDSKTRLFDPAHCINISIVFVDDGSDLSKQCIGQNNCKGCSIPQCMPQTFEGQNEIGKPFYVQQYVYQSTQISQKYINGLVKAIIESKFRGEYIDPLKATEHHANKKWELYRS